MNTTKPPTADRTAFIEANAIALVEAGEQQIARQHAELARLNQRCTALQRERNRLRDELREVHNHMGGIMRAIRTTLSASGILVEAEQGI